MDMEREARQKLTQLQLCFADKPILIGGSAMQYYGLRQKGKDTDLVITDRDYQSLAARFPDQRKDLWGDLGFVIGEFEIWRSIALFDYDFYRQGAVEWTDFYLLSLEKLLFTRVMAMHVAKYANDLQLILQYYYHNLQNRDYQRAAVPNYDLYEKIPRGEVLGGRYEEARANLQQKTDLPKVQS
ncbi:MAG: hypothetical protein LLG09_03040 [Negativicutes bacterium]|nr:hypothetical protein [Negativicutes bacterium]